MHISIENVLQIVTDIANFTAAIKSEVVRELSISTFTFDLDPF